MEDIIEKIFNLIKEENKYVEHFDYKNYENKSLYLEFYIKNKGE